jgi:hypothetical protein
MCALLTKRPISTARNQLKGKEVLPTPLTLAIEIISPEVVLGVQVDPQAVVVAPQ